MLVFIDESGDPGFRIAKGSSPVFVVAMVVFADRVAATRTQDIVRNLLGRVRCRLIGRQVKEIGRVRRGSNVLYIRLKRVEAKREDVVVVHY